MPVTMTAGTLHTPSRLSRPVLHNEDSPLRTCERVAPHCRWHQPVELAATWSWIQLGVSINIELVSTWSWHQPVVGINRQLASAGSRHQPAAGINRQLASAGSRHQLAAGIGPVELASIWSWHQPVVGINLELISTCGVGTVVELAPACGAASSLRGRP